MGKRIILCTNSVTLQKVVEWSLADNSYDIMRAKDAGETKNKLKKYTPDLIIIDQDIPEIGGISLCRELKAYEKYAGIPIVLLLRELDADEKEKEGIAAADDCKAERILSMPFGSKELDITVKELLHLEISKTDDSLKESTTSVRGGGISLAGESYKEHKSEEKVVSKDRNIDDDCLDLETVKEEKAKLNPIKASKRGSR